MMSMCALTPSTFCLNDCWNPDVTDKTTTSASTPIDTPTIETAVNPEKTLSSRKKRNRMSAGSDTLVPMTCALPCAPKTAASASAERKPKSSVRTSTARPWRRRYK